MNYLMGGYDFTLQDILKYGKTNYNKRTKISCKSVIGVVNRYNLSKDGHFPILTRRKVWPRAIFAELLWFISGSTNNQDLQALGSNIWTPWAEKYAKDGRALFPGDLGPIYGFQLRHFGGKYSPDGKHRGGIDQLKCMVEKLNTDPTSRDNLFSLWNPMDLSQMSLKPCHVMYQVSVNDDGELTGTLTQRSCDFPIGVPANIQFYSALTIMLAQQTGLKAKEFVHFTVDSHIYENQTSAVEEYLSRPAFPESPKLHINKASHIFDYKLDDFVLDKYTSLPKIDIPVAV